MTRLPNRRLLALALAASLAVPALAQAAEPFTVSDIRVDGLQRISSGTVFTYLPVERGETIDDTKVGDTIRALYKTGFFEDIRLDRQGDILVVTVKERPAINKLTVTGDLTIKDITKPVVLDVTINAAGEHPMMKVPAVGFDATTTLKRSDFGVGAYAPNVSDEVKIRITTEATGEKPAA